MACLAPWAFGAVEAWAELILYVGVALVALLGAISCWGTDWTRNLLCVPSLALAALILLAQAQATPLTEGVLRGIAPTTAALRADLLPGAPERVRGDSSPPVALPAPTISQHPEMTRDVVARLAAAWVLFQVVLGMEGEAPLRRFGLALAANATLLALFSLIQTLSWNGKIYWVREATSMGHSGPFINKNHLAAYLNLGLGFALSFLLSPGQRGSLTWVRARRLVAAYASGMIVVGVLNSFARGGFLAMLAASVVTFGVLKPKSLRVGSGLAVMFGITTVVLVGAGFLAPYERLATLFGSGAYTDRLAIWNGAMHAWSIYPLWGLGLGSFAVATARFFGHDDGNFFGHAEDEYVEVLVEGGVIGFVLGIVGLGSVVRLGQSALKMATDPDRRAPILGALFAVVALAAQCLTDFPMHIPAIAVPAAILAGHLVRLGLKARNPDSCPIAVTTRRRIGSALIGLLLVAVSLLTLGHGVEMARAEAAMASSGIAHAGYEMPTTVLSGAPIAELERTRAHLEHALRYRPDWAEGHVRVGLILLSEYSTAVAEEIGGVLNDPAKVEKLAEPLWLHGVVHKATAEQLAAAGGVLAQEPVRRYLVPAARSFLEARRCCPVWGLPHAELATLDYLIIEGESAPVYARRALRLAGSDNSTLATAAGAAAQGGDLDLAARCWRRSIEVYPRGWLKVADVVGGVLSTDQILGRLLLSGRYALLFADRLYRSPESRSTRDRFLRAAVERLPRDLDLAKSERLRLEAQAWYQLGESDKAREKMDAALILEPQRAEWRREFIEWLVGWGRIREAHDQALIGMNLAPDQPDTLLGLRIAAGALARGTPPIPDRDSH